MVLAGKHAGAAYSPPPPVLQEPAVPEHARKVGRGGILHSVVEAVPGEVPRPGAPGLVRWRCGGDSELQGVAIPILVDEQPVHRGDLYGLLQIELVLHDLL